ncbi:MAG: 6,7-dimethyl-8-ribityllumazine synthase [Rhizobiales bacterium]|nr:6,7-dimethyl-8-ribityllumazine synthase [Hyphomicrobiales bacterium]
MTDKAPHILIVDSPFHEAINAELVKGCVAALEAANVTYEKVSAPGALEIPLAATFGFETGRFDGVVVLGCVIRDGTSNYDIVVEQCAHGVAHLSLSEALPMGNAVLAVENIEQAQKQADSQGLDKGGLAAKATLKMIELQTYFEAQ